MLSPLLENSNENTDEVIGRATPGVNLMDLEHRARQLIAGRGAQSCYGDYAPSFGRGPFRTSSACRSTMRCCMGCRMTMYCVMRTC